MTIWVLTWLRNGELWYAPEVFTDQVMAEAIRNDRINSSDSDQKIDTIELTKVETK